MQSSKNLQFSDVNPLYYNISCILLLYIYFEALREKGFAQNNHTEHNVKKN